MSSKHATPKHGKYHMRRLASLITLLSTSTAASAQVPQQPKIPYCEASIAHGSYKVRVNISKQSNGEPFAVYTVPLRRIELRSMPGINMTNVSTYMKQGQSLTGKIISTGVTIRLDKSARNFLARPTGCSFSVNGRSLTSYNNASKIIEPMQMKGIDRGGKRPECSFRMGATHRQLVGAREFQILVHDAFDKNYMQARYSMLLDNTLKRQINNGIAGLKSEMNAGKCKPAPTSAGCFLTTAACEIIGLEDDCWELQSLRHFRDNWLQHQPEGMEDIARYYAQAPAICEALKSSSEGRHKLLKLYWTRIMPSAIAARLGLNRLTRHLYTKGMREVQGAVA